MQQIVKVERISHHEYKVYTPDAAYVLNLTLDSIRESLIEAGFRMEASDLQQAEERIRHMVRYDALTGLPNRLMLGEQMVEVFRAAQQSGKQSAVFFLNIDRLKVINDTLGHHVGDLLLQHWGERFQALVRPVGMAARFSGDEFILLLPEVDGPDRVAQMAKAIVHLFQTPFMYESQELYSSASIGIALFPQHSDEPDTLIQYADSAMHVAKRRGGNTYELYNGDHNVRSIHRLQLEIDLRKAVERGQILVHYQPIVSLATGRITGMEALTRWEHPQLGLISPLEFIPLAEETGLIVPIGQWILEEACRATRDWQRRGYPPVCVSVNISVKQFEHPLFVQTVRDALERTSLDPRYLCLEITENVAMTNIGHVVQTIQALKELGVAISIDDFGTGYSSLSYLKRFRIHTLKIDKSFIQELNADEESSAIVTALLAMAQRLNIRTIAEGVETAEQLTFLREHGCQEIQGYYISKPLAAQPFEQLLGQDRNFLDTAL